jgi:phytanoyl-CoA hydroxylase
LHMSQNQSNQLAPVYANTPIDIGEVEGQVIELHDPELYKTRAIITPIPGGLAAITEQHIALYRECGFLAINDVFAPEEVQAGLAGLGHLIMGGNPAFKGVQFEAVARDRLGKMALEERMDNVRKLMWFVDFDPRLHALAFHSALLALLTRMLEDTPVMFQDMGLIKPPRIGREKPWHQDKAYFNLDPRESVVGCWVALDKATVENGCMHLHPDLPLQPLAHFRRRDWQICDTEIVGKQCVAAPLKPGGVLLFDGLLVHGTPHNNSGMRRRAVQFHYRSNRYPKLEETDRLAIFGGEGKGVQC